MLHPKIAKAVRRKYNFLAAIYDIIWRNYVRKTVRYATEAVSLSGQEQLLDIGCGTGSLEQKLLEKNPDLKIVGIDISADMLERARKKLAPFSNVTLQEGDFLKVELPEEVFNIAFSLSNFHYFGNPLAVFQKAHRSLQKGGLFILIDWNSNSFQGKLYNNYMRLFDPAFVKAYTSQEVTEFFKKTGFSVQQVDYFRVGLRWRMMRLIAKKG